MWRGIVLWVTFALTIVVAVAVAFAVALCVCVCGVGVKCARRWHVTLDRKEVSVGGMLGVVVDAVVAELVVWVVMLCVGGMLGCGLCVG